MSNFAPDGNEIDCSRVVKVVLCVEDGEHPLVQMSEEASKRVFQVDLSLVVIRLEVSEEVDEDVRISFVDDAVSLLEELVEL